MVLIQFKVCVILLLVIVIAFTHAKENEGGTKTKCSYSQVIDSRTYHIYTTGYPNKYRGGESTTWCFHAKEKATFSLSCDIDIPTSGKCKLDALMISSGKDAQTSSYCGTSTFRNNYTSNNMIISFHSDKSSMGGKFMCSLQTYQPAVYKSYDCGYTFTPKIVGGEETGINEFPFMAGIVYTYDRNIRCGAAIISHRYVLSAALCVKSLDITHLFVLIGEHNTATGKDSNATKLLGVNDIMVHPNFKREPLKNDIALIQVKSTISFSNRVGPVCLCRYNNYDLTGREVTVLGWGTTEFAGPISEYLQKVRVPVIDFTKCNDAYNHQLDPNTQLCTFKKDSGPCLRDTGDPLVWWDPEIDRFVHVGVYSDEMGGCGEYPSVYTNTTAFLDWIHTTTSGQTVCPISR